MNPQPVLPDDSDRLRKEIQAAIAAGREVGPEMDQHLVDSVLEHYRQEQASQQRALARLHPQPPQRREFGGEVAQVIASNMSTALVAIVGLAAFVAILIWAPGYWWAIFFLPCLLGMLGWNRHSHQRHPSRYIAGPGGQGAPTNTDNRSGQDVEIV